LWCKPAATRWLFWIPGEELYRGKEVTVADRHGTLNTGRRDLNEAMTRLKDIGLQLLLVEWCRESMKEIRPL
jgi:hypothetical protein